MNKVHSCLLVFLLFITFSKIALAVPPHIEILSAPSAGDELKKGQRVYIKWRGDDSDGLTLHSVSLRKNGSDLGILHQSQHPGVIGYTWPVNATAGSGYSLHFFAVDTTGDFSEVDSPTFSIVGDPIINIPGHLLGDPDGNGSMTPTVGFGVNPVSGNFFHEETDVSLPGIELPFVFSRSYNSQDIPLDTFGNWLDLPLGFGWTHAYNMFLRFNSGNNQAELFWGDGRRDRFQKNGSAWIASSPANFNRLQTGGSGYAWKVITSDQTEFLFNNNLKLSQIRARTGQTVQLEYQNNSLRRVIDTAGRSIFFSYTNNLLSRIDVPPSRNIRFEYTNDYLLKDVIDMRGNHNRYVYRDGFLLELHRANIVPGGDEKPSMQIIYDNQPPYKVIKQHTAQTLNVGNPGYLFDWSIANKLNYNTPTGQGALFEWNANGQVTKTTPVNLPGGGSEDVSFEASTGPSSALAKTHKDLLGHTTLLSYDADSPQSPSQITLPDGKKYQMDFDGSNDLLSLTSPEGLNVQYVRNTWGKPESITTSGTGIPGTINTTATYTTSGDFTGQEKTLKDAGNGELRIVSRTVDGQPLEVREYISGGSYLKTLFNYDSAGRLVSTQDHRGTYTCFYYDANDNLTDTIIGLTISCNKNAPASVSVRHTRTVFDSDNRAISTTKGWGSAIARTISYTYHADTGQLIKVADHGGAREVNMVYDNDGRLFKLTYADTGREDRFYQMQSGQIDISYSNANGSQNTGARIERTERDGNGNVTHISSCDVISEPNVSSSDCDDDDVRVRYSYDNRQRLIQSNLSLVLNGNNPSQKRTSTVAYSADGRIVTTRTILPNSTDEIKKEQETDAAGRLIRVTEFDGATGFTTTVAYDGEGRATLITDANNLQTSYEYDRIGRPIKQTDLRGTVLWSYDDTNGKVTKTEPGGGKVIETYDRLNQLSQLSTSDGNLFSFTYDARGRMTKEIWSGSGGNGERNYIYTVFGELSSVTDSFGQTAVYIYDNAGRLSRRSYTGVNIDYTYNAFDLITGMDIPGNKHFQFAYQPFTQSLTSISFPNGVNTTYQRNPLGELELLTSHHNSLGNFLNYSMQLDGAGRRKQISLTQPTEAQYPRQDYQFGFDSKGLLATLNSKKINYDVAGNMTSLPSPIAASFVYDVQTRLKKYDTSEFSYDSGRNRIAASRNGSVTRYIWDLEPDLADVVATTDENNQVSEVFIHGPSGLLASLKGGNTRYVHQDFNHNVVALTNDGASVIGSYAYTPYGLTAGQQGVSDFPFGYAGGVGVMSELGGLNYMRARYYHPGIRRFTSGDLIHGSLENPLSLGRFSYTEGQPLSSSDPSGLLSIKERVRRQKNKARVTRAKRLAGKQEIVQESVNSPLLQASKISAKVSQLSLAEAVNRNVRNKSPTIEHKIRGSKKLMNHVVKSPNLSLKRGAKRDTVKAMAHGSLVAGKVVSGAGAITESKASNDMVLNYFKRNKITDERYLIPGVIVSVTDSMSFGNARGIAKLPCAFCSESTKDIWDSTVDKDISLRGLVKGFDLWVCTGKGIFTSAEIKECQ